MKKPTLFYSDYECIYDLKEELLDKYHNTVSQKKLEVLASRVDILQYMLDQFDVIKDKK